MLSSFLILLKTFSLKVFKFQKWRKNFMCLQNYVLNTQHFFAPSLNGGGIITTYILPYCVMIKVSIVSNNFAKSKKMYNYSPCLDPPI